MSASERLRALELQCWDNVVWAFVTALAALAHPVRSVWWAGTLVGVSPEDVALLEERAQSVGDKIGWSLHFRQLRNPNYVCLSADILDEDGQAHEIAIGSPARVTELAALDIDLELDRLDRGDSVLLQDGINLRLVHRSD